MCCYLVRKTVQILISVENLPEDIAVISDNNLSIFDMTLSAARLPTKIEIYHKNDYLIIISLQITNLSKLIQTY